MTQLYLVHHGVKGQHWGVQNGPPYPLDDSISTGHRLKGQEKKVNKIIQKASRKSDPNAYIEKQREATRFASNFRKKQAKGYALGTAVSAPIVSLLLAGVSPVGAAALLASSGVSVGATLAISKGLEKGADKKIKRYNAALEIIKNEKAPNLSKKEAQQIVQKWKTDNERVSNLSNKEAQQIVQKWKTDAVRQKVQRAKDTGTFDMEFIERNLDQDKYGNDLEGKALYDAYEKYLMKNG